MACDHELLLRAARAVSTAGEFADAYQRCMQDPYLLFPAATCGALAIEIGMKSLLLAAGRDERGHDLVVLYGKLEAWQREAIVGLTTATPEQFEELLEQSRGIFTTFRYPHERSVNGPITTDFLGELVKGVVTVARDSVPRPWVAPG